MASQYNSKSEIKKWLRKMLNKAKIDDFKLKNDLIKIGEAEIKKGSWRGDICRKLVDSVGFERSLSLFRGCDFYY